MKTYIHNYFVEFSKDKTILKHAYTLDEVEMVEEIESRSEAFIVASTIKKVRPDIQCINIGYEVLELDKETDKVTCLDCSCIYSAVKNKKGIWNN